MHGDFSRCGQNFLSYLAASFSLSIFFAHWWVPHQVCMYLSRAVYPYSDCGALKCRPFDAKLLRLGEPFPPLFEFQYSASVLIRGAPFGTRMRCRSQEDSEIILKTRGDWWVVGRKSDQARPPAHISCKLATSSHFSYEQTRYVAKLCRLATPLHCGPMPWAKSCVAIRTVHIDAPF